MMKQVFIAGLVLLLLLTASAVKSSSKTGRDIKGSSKAVSRAACPAPNTLLFQRTAFRKQSTIDEKHVGIVVSTSGDGTRVAVFNQNKNDAGVVQVWEEGTNGWSQLGKDVMISGKVGKEWWAFSSGMTSLASNGKVLAVAHPFANDSANMGEVKVYEMVDDEWLSFGGTISDIHSPRFDMSVALSRDGKSLVVATDSSSTNYLTGSVHFYGLHGNRWVKHGEVFGREDEIEFGGQIAFSTNGQRVAVSLRKPRDVVATRVFSTKSLAPIGDDIGQAGPMALNGDGTVLMIRENTYFDNNGVWSGPVPVREPSPSGSLSVSLSGDGKRALIGDPLRLTNKGRVEAFDFIGGQWCKMLQSLGTDDFVNYGESVSLSESGNRYAVGAPFIQFYYSESFWRVLEIN